MVGRCPPRFLDGHPRGDPDESEPAHNGTYVRAAEPLLDSVVRVRMCLWSRIAVAPFAVILGGRSMSYTVVQFDVNRRRHQIEQQEKRASDALLAASREFKRLAELKAK